MVFRRVSIVRTARRLGASGTPFIKLGLVLLLGACGGREGLAFETGTATGGEVGGATAISEAGGAGNTAGSTSSHPSGVAGAGGSIGVGSAGSGTGVGGTGVGVGVGGSTGTPIGTPAIGDDGYVKIDAGAYMLGGYVGSFVGGSASSITLTYDSTSFCASGTVGRNSTYQSYAGAGFNVDQTLSPTGGAVDSLPLSASSIVLNFTNAAHSPLRLQVIDSGVNYWCYDLSNARSPVTIPLSKLNTQCWDNSGKAFVPGTAITEIELIVPGSASASTPYNFCLEGLVIQ